MKNIFLFGYYGFHNTGDEAILEAIVKEIKEVVPQAKLTALSYNAKDTMKKYKIHAVSRNSFQEIIKAIKASDVVISGGGSILQDVTSSRSLLYYLAIILVAKKLGKRVMFYGNGFGPITGYLNKKLVSHIINQVDRITVRDYQSKEAMQALGIKKDIMVTADIALGLEMVDDRRIEKIFRQEEMDLTKKWVGISIREWKGQTSYKEVIAQTADYLISRNYKVVFIPMQFPSDINTSQEIADRMKTVPKIITKQYHPREMIGMISKLDLLLGMRLHSLVFSAIAEVPMVGLEYDTKITSFLKLTGQKSGGNVESLDMINLWTAIDSVIENRGEYIQQLKEIKKNLDKKVQLNVEIFKEFIQEGDKS
ncbi:polysaccharide pyruvyl transferase CsaB [Clostridium formicaceticum]|uniref:Colanic acid biosynthesis protein n=1 Tax=Clostridium formicaceticum TaxID=1497 RepID=A0AAC9RP30_9CLOT|nr:polysaccharide pyruvyl transferase CsaB [Clostridium formicaceticum]AOY74832.1 polysaccharide pyruvyl transferase CsaB [Clostridium formicaceticum]ARE89229.1 colanic acid biosynthesis protein [Clostridium formicaceticum]